MYFMVVCLFGLTTLGYLDLEVERLSEDGGAGMTRGLLRPYEKRGA